MNDDSKKISIDTKERRELESPTNFATSIVELSQEVDATQRAVAQLRNDLPNIIRKSLRSYFKEGDKSKGEVDHSS